MNLQNRVALVTGAAHRVGRGIALALAREGTHIVLHYGRSEEAARRTQSEIEGLGVEAFPVSADLADPSQIEFLFAATQERFGRLDVLVNSAARFDRQPFDEISVEDWDRTMQVNLRAPFLCTQQAARLMRSVERPQDEPAAIVNIVDLAGVYAWRNFTQHGVSKAGLLHLTRITARVLAPAIRVNALILGPIMPTQTKGVDETWQRIVSSLPLKRAGGPEVVGQSVVFLAQNDWITGAALDVDGGERLIGPYNY